MFVASYGSDSNNGTRTSPKRTFRAAYDAIDSGGEIVGLDTAGYASGSYLNIMKDISITMVPGSEGIVSAAGGIGLYVNAGLRVSLRGLRIEASGFNSGAGIYINAASSVEVDNCTITGFGAPRFLVPTGGIVTEHAGVLGHVVVTDTVIKDCQGSGIVFNHVGNTNSTLVVERCRLLANGEGLAAKTTGRVTVRNCTIAHNTGDGIAGGGVAPSDVKINVENCAVTDNGTGIASFTSNNVTVSNTAITGNTNGVTGTNGAPTTFGNNQLINNTTDGSFGPLVGQK
jgi:hypothetical protein